jgi:WD40 repeat protein
MRRFDQEDSTMHFGFLRFMQLFCIGTLTVVAASGHSRAQTSNQVAPQNSQANDKTKTQDVRPPGSLPTDPPSKKQIVFSRHDGAIPSIAFSPDGKRLASAGGNVVKVTDLETGKELLKLKNSRGMNYFSVAFSPDGRTLAGAQSMLKKRISRRQGDTTITTLTFVGEVLVWDSQTGKIKITLNDDEGPAWALAFSPDGKWLAVATGPTPEDKNCKDICTAFGEITLWETDSWKLVRRLRGNNAPLGSLAFSPDGQLLAAGAASLINMGPGSPAGDEFKFEIFLWDVATGELKQKFPGHTNSVTSLAFSPDNRLLASAGRDMSLKIWDCRTYELKKSASDQVLSVEEMQTIADAADAKSGKNAMPPVSALNAISFSRDGKQLIGGSGDSIIRFYDSASAKIVGVLKPNGWPFLSSFTPAFSPTPNLGLPNIDMIFRGSGPWRMPPGMRPSYANSLNSLALAPDGKTLAIGNIDGKIRLITLK